MLKRVLLLIVTLLAFINPAWAVVDINSADKSALETVKGIGPVKAQAIIDYRNAHGPFRSVDELEKVKGIGPGVLRQIRDQVKVGDRVPAGRQIERKPAEAKPAGPNDAGPGATRSGARPEVPATPVAKPGSGKPAGKDIRPTDPRSEAPPAPKPR